MQAWVWLLSAHLVTREAQNAHHTHLSSSTDDWLCAALCLLQTALGFTIQLPTGMSSHTLTDVSALGSGSSRIADVLLTDSYTAYTDTQRANTVAFLQQGAGMVTGGQAWWVAAAWHAVCHSYQQCVWHTM